MNLMSCVKAASPFLLTLALASAVVAEARLPTYAEAGLAWKNPPSPEWMGRFFPMRSHFKGINKGSATVRCTARANGTLDCTVIEETPEGGQFGDSAIWVMKKVKVRAVDGGSPEGRTFGYTLRFGNYRPRELPREFQPADAGLRWVKTPTLVGWSQSGQHKGQTISADFDCLVKETGWLNCQLLSVTPANPAYGRAALKAMDHAIVEREDGSPGAGVRFHWRLAVMSTNDCGGTGGYGVGPVDVAPAGGGTQDTQPAGAQANSSAYGHVQMDIIKRNGSDCRGAQVVVY